MNTIKALLLAGPTYTALSNERRKAFLCQRAISGIILVIGTVTVLITIAVDGNSTIAPRITLGLLVAQLIYALVRKETAWQLRIRELQYRSNAQKTNKEELLAYAEKLKRGQK